MLHKILLFLLLPYTAYIAANGHHRAKALSSGEQAYYQSAIDGISNNYDIKKGILFLIGKKCIPHVYYKSGRYKFTVSDFRYDVTPNQHELVYDHQSDTTGRTFLHLSDFSTVRRNAKFTIFFSTIQQNYFECKIVRNSKNRHVNNNDYAVRTNFGKVVRVKFYIENQKVIVHKVESAAVN